jgi:predicted transcriptional regulator
MEQEITKEVAEDMLISLYEYCQRFKQKVDNVAEYLKQLSEIDKENADILVSKFDQLLQKLFSNNLGL